MACSMPSFFHMLLKLIINVPPDFLFLIGNASGWAPSWRIWARSRWRRRPRQIAPQGIQNSQNGAETSIMPRLSKIPGTKSRNTIRRTSLPITAIIFSPLSASCFSSSFFKDVLVSSLTTNGQRRYRPQ